LSAAIVAKPSRLAAARSSTASTNPKEFSISDDPLLAFRGSQIRTMVAAMLFELANLLFFQAAHANPNEVTSSCWRAQPVLAPHPPQRMRRLVRDRPRPRSFNPSLVASSLFQPASLTALSSCFGGNRSF
jgi:hypothetical protein